MGQSIQEQTSKSRPYAFKFLKGCLPQILLGPLLNTLSHIYSDELNKQVNNLTSLITTLLDKAMDIYFYFVYVKAVIIFDLFLFRKFTFFILLIPSTLYISWCLANV